MTSWLLATYHSSANLRATVADNEETEIVAFRFGCVVCVERIEDGPWKLAWMIVPALLTPRRKYMRLGRFTIAGETCGKVGLRNQPCRAHSVARTGATAPGAAK